MLMADGSSNLLPLDESSASDDYSNDLYIDLDSLWSILGENPDPAQSRPEDSSLSNVPQGLPKMEQAPSFGAELPGSVAFSPSFNPDSSYSRMGFSDNSFQSTGNYFKKLEPPLQIDSPVLSCSGSLTDWMPAVPGYGHFSADRDVVTQNSSPFNLDDSKDPQNNTSDGTDTFSFAAGEVNPVSAKRETPDFSSLKDSHHIQLIEKMDVNYEKHCDSSEYSLKTLEANIEEASFMDIGIPDILCGPGDEYSSLSYCSSTDDLFDSGSVKQFFPDSFYIQSMSPTGETMINMKHVGGEILTQNATLNNAFEAQIGRTGEPVMDAERTSSSDARVPKVKCEGGYYISPNSSNLSYGNKPSTHLLPHTQNKFSTKQTVCMKDEKNDELVALQSMAHQSFEGDDMVCGMSSGVGDQLSADRGLRQSLSGVPPSMSSENHVIIKDEKDVFPASKRRSHSCFRDESDCRNPTLVADGHCLDVKIPVQPHVQASTSITKRHLMEGNDSSLTPPKGIGSHLLEVDHQVQNNALDSRSHVDDDSDICILEDMSVPARVSPSPVNGTSLVTSQTSQCATFSKPLNHKGVGGLRLRTNDERFIFRVALQDLSQPKSEATPPDGVLAVPLLRHQRIALSWMVHKETVSLHCSGGILADDQGLGKTISTIALILKERSPSSKLCSTTETKQTEMETLNLDEDEDEDEPKLDGLKQAAQSFQVNGSTIDCRSTSVLGKGRPAAGTLVVCPTSVLRQWYEELGNKVTSKANLSVLLYHGGNRTKDPFELAKYDVVLTTYSIVSMEVPKQPLVDEDDDEAGKQGQFPPMGFSSSKKRKYPPSCDKRSLKGKKGIDNDLLESTARPLARVGWFRVVLDEAQSIKNHRTQVARACWGLRAKRRWCLSGTPIQNAVDDLYSYFRFLRYDPYAVYKSFCSTIKVPIHKNPTNGYRKLQAVLKTIMLRRTKGTLLDGEPIINLPPKTIELKKVDFTKEERDFYCRLEADSRAQFAEYAAAGTVKQNYVNILLMLLRLRQACDHPLLVGGCNSNSGWRSSVEVAKKLTREKQVSLLNCLEASLAICGICNDPPEDAVVTSCGHVFCNQCISEHLTGDDHQCPTRNCKAQLSVSLVFSRASLRSSLSENTANSCGSELAETPEPSALGCLLDSSKIKAALEVLQSLSKPLACASRTSSSTSIDEGATLEISSDPLSVGLQRDMPDNRSLDFDGSSNDMVPMMGEKAIVFSQWTRMLDLLEACLKNSSIKYRRLDGTMSVVARDKAVKDFNTLPEVSVMIMSLKAASLGLNMVAACHVLLLDLWWNPTTEDQAIDRAHRIGQTRPVTVLRLTVKDTVEDRILALQQKKREMVASAFGEDETGSRQTRLTVEDLKYLFMA
ncbi:unnamed protein product [Ilex paraguariensis]|uniref:Helicase-like transcription factor CHR28 n=1 Tax=Ilex paraguariensis TaxID=185542 RepID=A0ABC8QV76_9AQUA